MTTMVDRKGPSLISIDPWLRESATPGKLRQLLTDDERGRLAVIASIVRFKKGENIYRGGDRSHAVFNIIGGVVKTYADNDATHIVSFLFPNDLFGLAEEGKYSNSAMALTAVTAYQLPVATLRAHLSKDALLEYHVICKLCEELRQAQRHAFLLSQRHAESKIAIFLQMLEQLQVAKGEPATEIYVPMDRSDIGEYVGLSLAAVSRTFASLSAKGVIRNRDRRHVRVVDRPAFERILANGTSHRAGHRRKSEAGRRSLA